jgi:hypothetical protein
LGVRCGDAETKVVVAVAVIHEAGKVGLERDVLPAGFA